MGLRRAQKVLVHIRSDQGNGGTSSDFPDLWLSRDPLCPVIVRLCGQTPQRGLWVGSWEFLQPHSHNGLLFLQSLVHTRSSR